MKKDKKITVLFLTVCFFLFSVVCWMKPQNEISVSERRKLTQLPAVSMQSVTSGRFMEKFEKYAADQFPFRDGLRTVKAWFSGNLLRNQDNNGIYVTDGFAVKMEYPLNEKAFSYAGERFRNVYETYLKESGSEIYFSIIPDKNYFTAKESGHLEMDYEKLFSVMQEEVSYAKYIELTDLLSIEDYYSTDVHWRQEKLVDIAERIAGAMGTTVSGSYETRTVEKPFYGVYYGQSALPLKAEKLHYLTNETLEACMMKNYEDGTEGGIYDLEKAGGNDLYEIFLSGPVSLLTIENPAAETDRELIIFRDSFGSSLAPLLAEGYAKITLVDIRYLSSSQIGNYIDFADKDVLFLYSTSVLNHSETLK